MKMHVNVCLCAHVCVHMHVHVLRFYLCASNFLHAFMCTFITCLRACTVLVCADMHSCMLMRMHVCVCVCVCARAIACACAHMYWCVYIYGAGQFRKYTPYMTPYWVIPVPKLPQMHRKYLANPTFVCVYMCVYAHVSVYVLCLCECVCV